MNKNVLTLGLIVILIVGSVVGLAIWLKSTSPTPIAANPDIKGEKVFVRPNSHMTGKQGAKVTVVEFGDFQCPFCAEASPTVTQVINKYKNNPDFNFVFRNFPLPQHSNAQISAEAAEAAGAQAKYWEMEGLLYQHQNDWAGSVNPTGIFAGYAQQLGLDVNKFSSDLKNSKYIDNITQDQKDGEALGVNSTPTFFLNGQKLGSYTELDGQIGALLSK
jgi:protein-disulfide isomerase